MSQSSRGAQPEGMPKSENELFGMKLLQWGCIALALPAYPLLGHFIADFVAQSHLPNLNDEDMYLFVVLSAATALVEALFRGLRLLNLLAFILFFATELVCAIIYVVLLIHQAEESQFLMRSYECAMKHCKLISMMSPPANPEFIHKLAVPLMLGTALFYVVYKWPALRREARKEWDTRVAVAENPVVRVA